MLHGITRLFFIALAAGPPSLTAKPSFDKDFQRFFKEFDKQGDIPTWSALSTLVLANDHTADEQGRHIDFASGIGASRPLTKGYLKEAFLKVLGGPRSLPQTPLSQALEQSNHCKRLGVWDTKIGNLPIGVYLTADKRLVVRILEEGEQGKLTKVIKTDYVGPRLRKVFKTFWDQLEKELGTVDTAQYIAAQNHAFNWLWKTCSAPPESLPVVGLLQPGMTQENCRIGEIQQCLIWCLQQDKYYEEVARNLFEIYKSLQ